MTDIRTVWIDGQSGDWRMASNPPGLLEAEAGLETAVLLSLFTDRRAADSDELPAGETDPRGWWGEVFAEADDPPLGSRLWLLAREKQTTEVLARARLYAEEALEWLVADKVARSLSVATEWIGRGVMSIDVKITRPGGAGSRFAFIWQETGRDAV